MKLFTVLPWHSNLPIMLSNIYKNMKTETPFSMLIKLWNNMFNTKLPWGENTSLKNITEKNHDIQSIVKQHIIQPTNAKV